MGIIGVFERGLNYAFSCQKIKIFLGKGGLQPPHAKTLLQIRILCFKNVTLLSFPNNVIYVYRLILRKVRLERALNYAF